MSGMGIYQCGTG